MILYQLQKQVEKLAFDKLLQPDLQRVQINFIFTDNVHILCLFCNTKMPNTTTKFYEKEQKQALFHSFLCHVVLCCCRFLPFAVHESGYLYMRRIKHKFICILLLYSKYNDCRIHIQYTYIVGKYIIYLHKLQRQVHVEK